MLPTALANGRRDRFPSGVTGLEITLLTDPPPRSLASLRHALRHVRNPRLFAPWGGPLSVRDNLRLGLDRCAIRHRLNDFQGTTPYVGVLRSVDALRWAIRRKREGRIRVLVAGPNIVMLPTEFDGVVSAPEIDRYVVPSEWTRDEYVAMCPQLRGQIAVWPVGVDEERWRPDPAVPKTRDFLIYPKRYPPSLLERIRHELDRRGLSYTLLRYGAYRPDGYRDLLTTHRWMLFLSESESQGIALFEAWSCDVPTLVWDRSLWEFGPHRWPGTSAPYLAPETGLSFRGEDDLAAALDRMGSGGFAPRAYVLARFTAAAASRAYARLFLDLD